MKGNVKAITTPFRVGDQEKYLYREIVCLKLIMPLSLTVILIHTLCCKYSGPFKMETVQCTWRFQVVHLLVHRNLKASACVKVKSVLPVPLCTHELVKVCELNLFPKIDLFAMTPCG